MTKGDKLKAILELKDPILRLRRLVHERTVLDALLKLELMEGPTGREGYTPVRGKDYFTPQDIQAFLDYLRAQIKDGAPGKDGNHGIDGDTPVLGVDYFTASDKDKIVKEVLKRMPKQKPLKIPTVEDIAAEVRKKPINYEEIMNAPDLTDLPKLIAFLRAGGFRGGGSSTGGNISTTFYSEQLTDSGDHQNFTALHNINSVLSLMDGTGRGINSSLYTKSGSTLTLSSADANVAAVGIFITYA